MWFRPAVLDAIGPCVCGVCEARRDAAFSRVSDVVCRNFSLTVKVFLSRFVPKSVLVREKSRDKNDVDVGERKREKDRKFEMQEHLTGFVMLRCPAD